jgi:hypothetical protein
MGFCWEFPHHWDHAMVAFHIRGSSSLTHPQDGGAHPGRVAPMRFSASCIRDENITGVPGITGRV